MLYICQFLIFMWWNETVCGYKCILHYGNEHRFACDVKTMNMLANHFIFLNWNYLKSKLVYYCGPVYSIYYIFFMAFIFWLIFGQKIFMTTPFVFAKLLKWLYISVSTMHFIQSGVYANYIVFSAPQQPAMHSSLRD